MTRKAVGKGWAALDKQIQELAKQREIDRQAAAERWTKRHVHDQELVRPEDLHDALKAAGVPAEPGEDADLPKFAKAASSFAWRVVVWQLFPPIPEIRKQGDEFERIETVAALLRSLLLRDLAVGKGGTEHGQEVLATKIASSRDIVHIGALEGIQVTTDLEPTAEFANWILVCERIIAATDANREAVESGATKELKSRHGKSPARDLGMALIDCYIRLTGNPARSSRGSTGENEGKVGGPLIRFLSAVFASLRERIEASEDIARLATGKVWRPTNETLRTWIDRFLASVDSPLERKRGRPIGRRNVANE